MIELGNIKELDVNGKGVEKLSLNGKLVFNACSPLNMSLSDSFAPVTVCLTGSLNCMKEGASIDFYMVNDMTRTLLDSVDTNSQGQAVYEYTVDSLETTEFVAVCGDLESETVKLNDWSQASISLTGDKSIIQTGESCSLSASLSALGSGLSGFPIEFIQECKQIFYDTGVTGTTAVYGTNSKETKTVSATGTLWECQSGKEWATISPIEFNYEFILPFRVEFNVVDVTTSFRIQIDGDQRFYIDTTGSHVIDVTEDGVFFDGVDKGLSVSSDRVEFVFQLPNSSHDVTLKDFRVIAGYLIDTVTTDENGMATVSYTGEHAGLLNIRAECMNLIETYSILDAYFYVDGTTDTSNWQVNTTNTTITYDNDGTHFSGGGYFKLKIGSNLHYFDGTKDLCFEFEIKTSKQVTPRYINNSGSEADIIALNNTIITFNEWNNVKLQYSAFDNTITPIVNGVARTVKSTSNTATIGIQINDWSGNLDCSIKEFKVYSI